MDDVGDKISSGLLHTLLTKLEHLTLALEKASIAEYIELYRKPKRLLYINFLAGIARGLASPSALLWWGPFSSMVSAKSPLGIFLWLASS